MKEIKRLFFLALLLLSFGAEAQMVKLLSLGKKFSLRGLSVVNDKTVWVSGSSGTVGMTTDGGENWKWMTVKGYEKTDFRDIEAFNDNTAIIMGIDVPANILKTTDGGETWKPVFVNSAKGMFLDAMEFWNENSGIVIGDPIDNKFFIARTFDGGNTWLPIPEQNKPVADSGEACFASSGTNIRALNKQEAVFISGGLRSRLFIRDKKIDLPIIQGTESTGANSVAVKSSKYLIVVGGDFNKKDATEKNCFITSNGGKSFSPPQTPPHGYRSCVEYLGDSKWISCGLNGVDYSTDDGKNWSWIGKQGFHVVRKAMHGNAVYFAGGEGRIGKLEF
ncbi:MAG: oxidoreductase [Chitinophagaceae bacterium]|nr:oxidoreductase [Chitinophagaceae bacterium]